MKVVEIFSSIDGEGKRTGLPVTFVRLYGCNLECSYCDTRYACEDGGYVEMSVDEIVDKVYDLGIKAVTVTGGEPLIHQGIEELVLKLAHNGCDVNIETNGSAPLGDFIRIPHVWVTMDWKSPSSGMHDRNCADNLGRLRSGDVLKFVVGSKADLDDMSEVVLGLRGVLPQVYVSPVFGEIEPSEIVDYVLQHRLYNVKVQVQLHKVIWPADMRGV